MAKPKDDEGDTKLCFVISPIGNEGSATRARSDKLLKYVIRAVFEPKGYKVERADKVSEPGIITNQIIRRIVDCDVLVADLSEHNPNVFYELAIRHGLKKPFIHIINLGEKIPFDNAPVRTIQIDLTDLDSVEEANKELLAQLETIELGTVPVESPISIAFELETLKTSGKPDDALLVTVVEQLNALRRDLRSQSVRYAPTMRFRPPETEAQLISLLERVNQGELAEHIRNNVKIIEISKGTIVGMPAPDAHWEDVDDKLETILTQSTGQKWRVSITPF